MHVRLYVFCVRMYVKALCSTPGKCPHACVHVHGAMRSFSLQSNFHATAGFCGICIRVEYERDRRGDGGDDNDSHADDDDDDKRTDGRTDGRRHTHGAAREKASSKIVCIE